MDFDDIQKAWNSENNENVSLPSNLEKIQTANTPLDKIKLNLKNEFWYQVISIVLIGVLPIIFKLPNTLYSLFYLLFSIFLGICVYYLLKFYQFYKRLNQVSLNTKDSLYETYFDIKLNMEIYKSFGFAIVPFLIFWTFGILYSAIYKNYDIDFLNLQNSHLIFIGICVGACILYMGFAVEWWVKHFYGKYLVEIRNVIDELKE